MEEPGSHNLSLSPTNVNCTPITTNSSNPPPLDYDVIVILAAMICALVCALGLNSTLHCVLRCTRRALAADPAAWLAARRLNARALKPQDLVALPVATYSAPPPAASASSPAASTGCPICLSEFIDGDEIRVLPACSHRFHVGCIDTWLLAHCSCPTCRHRLLSVPAPAPQSSSDAVPLEILTAS